MKKFEIEDHNHFDKEFGLYNDVVEMRVDYDDVNHDEVDVAAEYIKKILNEHWNEEEFRNLLRIRLINPEKLKDSTEL